MWPLVALSDVAAPSGLAGGPFGSSLVGTDYRDSGVPVIRGSNLGNRDLSGDFAFVSREKFERDLARNSATSGDLVFTQRGTLGQISRVPSGAHPVYVVSQSQMRLRVDPSKASADYVYYACNTPAFHHQIDVAAIRTGVPHINLGILGGLEIPLPPLNEQQAIAEVLGALDDKIAANARLVATSLELGRALHQRTLQETEHSKCLYTDVASVGGGATPSTKRPDYWDGRVPWVAPSDVTALSAPYLDDTPRHITESGLAACSSPLYPVGSILMTSRATIGAFAVNQVPTAVNQGFIVVAPKEPELLWWLFHEMQRRVPEYLNRANGATFLELPRGIFRAMAFDLPAPAIVRSFHEMVAPIHARALAAERESRTLAELRDALLPALMDGTIRVKDAVATAEEAL